MTEELRSSVPFRTRLQSFSTWSKTETIELCNWYFLGLITCGSSKGQNIFVV